MEFLTEIAIKYFQSGFMISHRGLLDKNENAQYEEQFIFLGRINMMYA